MRSLLLCSAAAVALTAPAFAQRSAAPSPAAAPAAAAEQWRSYVYELHRGVEPADAPGPDLSAVAGRLARWRPAPGLTTADIPEDLRRRPFSGITFLVVDVDPDGAATGCRLLRSSGDPRLDRIACEGVAAQGGFPPLYAGPGRPVAARWLHAIGWETLDPGRAVSAFAEPVPLPPAPVGPPDQPGIWPRLHYSATVWPISLPAIQPLFPRAARRREGIVSLDLVTTAEGGIDCRIGVDSGDAALDEAACAAARGLILRYERPATWWRYATLPLQIVWRRRGGSHIRLPLLPHWRTDLASLPRDPADTRTATHMSRPQDPHLVLEEEDYAGVPPSFARTNLVWLNVATDRAGRVRDCSISQFSGPPVLEARLCPLARERLRLAPFLDIFGTPVEAIRPLSVAIIPAR